MWERRVADEDPHGSGAQPVSLNSSTGATYQISCMSDVYIAVHISSKITALKKQ